MYPILVDDRDGSVVLNAWCLLPVDSAISSLLVAGHLVRRKNRGTTVKRVYNVLTALRQQSS